MFYALKIDLKLFGQNGQLVPWLLKDVFLRLTNFRILTDTLSVKMEPAQPMSCSVSNSFEAENNEIEIDSASVSTINANFELSSEDIS